MVEFRNGPAMPMPALDRRMSIRPKVSMASLTVAIAVDSSRASPA